LGVVGLNGCGKSTLFRILSGELRPDAGVVRTGRGARIGVLPQLPVLPNGTVRDAVGGGWQGEAMLDKLGMGDMVEADTRELSGGQLKRVALARLLAGEWDCLILDEPTNHLDLDAIGFLEETLARFPGGLAIVTHDRHVLDRVTNRVLEIDRGHAYLHIPAGENAGSGYAAYLAARAEREENSATAEQVRKNAAKKELAWLRRGAPARTAKPKARIAAAEALIANKPDGPARQGELGLDLGSKRLGSKGIEMLGVGFTWPDGHEVLHAFDHALEPGDRLGIVGPNGAGKSTLLDMIAGRLTATVGTIDIGKTVLVGYYDQLGKELDLSKRVRDVVAGDKGSPSVEDLNLMKRFWFDGDAQFAPLNTLSGGERRRLQLLLTLIEQPNVLLLDEPTNDLDLDTLRALEDYLDDWPGIVVVVSHDRAFIDRTVEEILALDGEGGAALVPGGVATWLQQRSARVSTPRSAPNQRSSSTKPAKQKSSRSPSTLNRLIANVEKDMTKRTTRQTALYQDIADAGNDHKKLAALGEELAALQTAIESLETQWLELTEELGS
ncbi:MAG: ABC-F family ATP-binding cassette domain-containing protein, partial [Actinobacteria bacterium]|nr:ABC-F family ATP-binding cassette domain-containing protein [Actinomycetota bacterium]